MADESERVITVRVPIDPELQKIIDSIEPETLERYLKNELQKTVMEVLDKETDKYVKVLKPKPNRYERMMKNRKRRK